MNLIHGLFGLCCSVVVGLLCGVVQLSRLVCDDVIDRAAFFIIFFFSPFLSMISHSPFPCVLLLLWVWHLDMRGGAGAAVCVDLVTKAERGRWMMMENKSRNTDSWACKHNRVCSIPLLHYSTEDVVRDQDPSNKIKNKIKIIKIQRKK